MFAVSTGPHSLAAGREQLERHCGPRVTVCHALRAGSRYFLPQLAAALSYRIALHTRAQPGGQAKEQGCAGAVTPSGRDLMRRCLVCCAAPVQWKADLRRVLRRQEHVPILLHPRRCDPDPGLVDHGLCKKPINCPAARIVVFACLGAGSARGCPGCDDRAWRGVTVRRAVGLHRGHRTWPG